MEPTVTHTKCRCTVCGDYFNSAAAFDKHRDGPMGPERRCLSHEERRAKKMDVNNNGYWVTALRVWDQFGDDAEQDSEV